MIDSSETLAEPIEFVVNVVIKRWFCLLLLLGIYVQGLAENRGTYGQQVVAAVLMAEAWGEGRDGMTAVAEVIRNRADE